MQGQQISTNFNCQCETSRSLRNTGHNTGMIWRVTSLDNVERLNHEFYDLINSCRLKNELRM